MGNRTESLSLSDFTNHSLLLPSYPSLALWNKKRQSIGHHNLNATPIDEHKHNMIARGAWHVMSPLSHLVTFFSEDHGPLMASFLRPGQLQWTRQQFVCVTTFLRLPPVSSNHQQEQSSLSDSPIQESVDTEAEYLARVIRDRAIFMSGL